MRVIDAVIPAAAILLSACAAQRLSAESAPVVQAVEPTPVAAAENRAPLMQTSPPPNNQASNTAVVDSLVQGRWKRVISVDRLTREKNVMAQNRALSMFRQFGRNVTATLVVQCGGERTLPTAGRGDLIGTIMFSEPVGISEVGYRYRFDDDPVQTSVGGTTNRGAGMIFALDERISRLRASSKLLIEVELPWAGNVLLQFNMVGADAAVAGIPCALPE